MGISSSPSVERQRAKLIAAHQSEYIAEEQNRVLCQGIEVCNEKLDRDNSDVIELINQIKILKEQTNFIARNALALQIASSAFSVFLLLLSTKVDRKTSAIFSLVASAFISVAACTAACLSAWKFKQVKLLNDLILE